MAAGRNPQDIENNVGRGVLGAVEKTSDAAVRAVYDTIAGAFRPG